MIKFDEFEFVDGGVCTPSGFFAGGINVGVKKGSTKKDLAIIYSDVICNSVALYTQNKVKGAPIIVTQENLKDGKAQAVIVNSGNANTCNENGIEVAKRMCSLSAKEMGIDEKNMIVASTGVIGEPLNIEAIEAGIPTLVKSINSTGSKDFCQAIMTTDTREKELAVEFALEGRRCYIGGVSKGSGMINPNMATMLAFLTTDVAINSEMLHKALKRVNEVTYNMVSVDGDTSTNDMVCILSSAKAKNSEITKEDDNFETFVSALYAVMLNLARETARDGEGATKLLECFVVGAVDDESAKSIAKSIISSSLVKTAMYASDANWGRILCAIGYAEGDFDISRVSVEFASDYGKVVVCAEGAGIHFSEKAAKQVLSADEVKILIDFKSGDGKAVAWGCDLTYDYVKINADYRT